MTRIEKVIWPFALVVSVSLAGLAVLAAGDALGLNDEIVQWAQGILSAIAAGVGSLLVLALAIDRNRNGIPDIVERLLVWLGLLDDDPAPRPSGRRRRETIRPPDEGGGPGAGVALLLLGLALGAAAGTTGCGGGTYQLHGIAGTVLRDSANTAGVAIREVRADSIRAEARAVDPEPAATFSERLEAAIEGAAARWDEAHRDLIDGQRTAAHATNAYIGAAFDAIRGLQPGEAVAARARDATRAANALGDILRRNGFPDLPAIPENVAAFLAGFLTGGDR